MTGSERAVIFAGKEYPLDNQGYLSSPDRWDENFAIGMAEQVGIFTELTPAHWRLIRYLRNKYLNEHTLPFVVPACVENNLRISMLKRLFPSGYMRGACRLAGMSYDFLCTHNHLLTYENYATLTYQFPVTDTGYLIDFEVWDRRFAAYVASDWNLPHGLTEKHFEILNFLRNSYRERKNIPTVIETCKVHSVDLTELEQLFPEGYRRGACRAAGLPFMP